MPVEPLTLWSEPYARSGNLAADGFRKLLGTPALGLLQTVIREAVQNSCDASKAGLGTEIVIRVRALSPSQRLTLRRDIFKELPSAPDSREPLETFLASENGRVLEICDFGTTGLGGPTRADRVVDGEPTDFVDFLRNVGSSRDTRLGGGTYGYGKTSLYLSSRCTTILVDSQANHNGADTRRLMACHLGKAHAATTGAGERRYTGRHWWGQRLEDDFVDPAEDEPAKTLADQLGLPERGPGRRGTSIMILDPHLADEDPALTAASISESLLWYFWPRMMASTPPDRRIRASVELDGVKLPLPTPEAFPPLDLFARAMDAIRTGDPAVETIESLRPKKLLGRVGLVRGLVGRRHNLVPASSSLIPHQSAHIAVMRPVELVVRYYEGTPLPDGGAEWAGVFVADSDRDVESAFAESEPPAHDDWQPALLASGRRKSYVNVAINRLKDYARSYALPAGPAPIGGDGGPSLARVAEAFGQLLTSVVDRPVRSGRGAGGRAARRPYRIDGPTFDHLEMGSEGPVAVFAVAYDREISAEQDLVATPSIMVDGAPLGYDDAPADVSPRVLDWIGADGSVVAVGRRLPLRDASGRLMVRVALSGECVVGLDVSFAEAGSSR
jgi:hypothetical protein